MADDETITIRVNAAQGEAALKALGAAGVQAATDVEKLGESGKSATDKYAALGAKILGVTKVVAAAGTAIKEVAVATGNYSGATKDAIDQVQNLTQAVASFDLAGTAAALGQLVGQTVAWSQGLNEVNVELGNAVNKQATEALREVLDIQKKLVDTQKESVAALQLRTAALTREIEAQKANGDVSKYLKDQLKDVLDTHEKLDVFVPGALQRQASGLDVVSTSAEKSAEKVKELADEHAKALEKVVASISGESQARNDSTNLLLEAIKVAESHGDVTTKSAAKIKEAVAAEIALYKQFGDEVPENLQAVADKYKAIATEQSKVIANAQKIIADIDAAAIKANQDQGDPRVNAASDSVDQLKKQIKDLEDQPVFGLEQQNQLDDMKNALLDATRAARDANRQYTLTADNFLTDTEAAQKLEAELQILGEAQDFLADQHRRAMNAADRNSAATKENAKALRAMEEAAGDAGGSLSDLGESFEDIGDSADDGTKKASDGLKSMAEDQDTVIEKNERIKAQLAEIKQLASEITLE